MSRSITLALFVSILAMSCNSESVQLQAYYESMCPYSMQWFREQLYPTWAELKEYMVVDFTPFGNANFTAVGNGWCFMCQHGPDECIGNLYQSCYIDKETDANRRVDVINCIMGTDPPYNATEAVISINISY